MLVLILASPSPLLQVLSPTDRSSLLNDAFSLADAGKLPYPTVLSLVAYMKRETHYIPWKTVTVQLSTLGRLLRQTKAYPYFRVSWEGGGG